MNTTERKFKVVAKCYDWTLGASMNIVVFMENTPSFSGAVQEVTDRISDPMREICSVTVELTD